MPRALIIGYGNTLRRDDGAGVIAAVALQRELDGRDDVRVLALQQLTPELAADLVASDRVLFIDASAAGRPGTVDSGPISAPAPPLSPFETGHSLTPTTLLGLARDLYGTVPPALLLTVAGGDFNLGEGLSTPVRTALPQVLERSRSWLRDDGDI